MIIIYGEAMGKVCSDDGIDRNRNSNKGSSWHRAQEIIHSDGPSGRAAGPKNNETLMRS